MLNFNLTVIVYIIVFYFTGIAQSDYLINSTKVDTNSGLIFEKELESRFVNSSYTDVIQLLGLSDRAQGLQFRLLINKSPDDSTILIFQDIKKGTDLSDPGWLLDYNLIKGPVGSNGASKDEIYIVLYNTNQNGGLLPGDHSDLFNIIYKIADIPDLQNNIKSSMKISHTEVSTFEGNSININSTRDELKIYIKKK